VCKGQPNAPSSSSDEDDASSRSASATWSTAAIGEAGDLCAQSACFFLCFPRELPTSSSSRQISIFVQTASFGLGARIRVCLSCTEQLLGIHNGVSWDRGLTLLLHLCLTCVMMPQAEESDEFSDSSFGMEGKVGKVSSGLFVCSWRHHPSPSSASRQMTSLTMATTGIIDWAARCVYQPLVLGFADLFCVRSACVHSRAEPTL